MRAWIALSLGCSLYALYEGIEQIVTGHEIEGVLELVVMAVITVNTISRIKLSAGNIDKVLG